MGDAVFKPAAERERMQEVGARKPQNERDKDALAAPPEEPPFPSWLDGFELSEGLRRLRGNESLYRKLLLKFGATYAQTADAIRLALDARDFHKAHSLIHDVKGLAGNLAALELHAAAGELEKLVKNVDEKAPPSSESLNRRFTLFEGLLDQALRAVRSLEPVADEPVSARMSDHGPGELMPDLAREAAGRLRDAAEMGDVAGLRAVGEEMTSRSASFAPYRDRIAQMADDFDFDGVIALAGDLERMHP